MSLAHAPTPITFDDFLTWSARQPTGRYDFVHGEVVEMPAEGGLHNLVKGALFIALKDAAKRAGFLGTVFTDGMSVPIEHKTWREPDAAVTATPVADKTATKLVDPLIVAEVVSPSSERDDTGDKLNEYFSVPSIQHYLIVRPEKKLIIHHARGTDGKLITAFITEPTLKLDPPGLIVDLAPVFEAC